MLDDPYCEQLWIELEKSFSDALNETNRKTYSEMDLSLRRGILIEALNDGIIQLGAVTKRKDTISS